MRNSPVLTVDPADLPIEDRDRIDIASAAAIETGTLDLDSLPDDVREQLLFTLDALARGSKVAAVADGKPLTTTEAADLLGMSRSHLIRLCEEDRIESFTTGTQRRIPATEVTRILTERSRATARGREASATSEERRRRRAAQAAGLR